MHVVFLNPAYDFELQTPEELLRCYQSMPGCAEGMVAMARGAGFSDARATVVQRFHHDAVFESDGIAYRFVDDGFGPKLAWWQESPAVISLAAEECRTANREGTPAVVHLNGLVHAATVPKLRRALPPGVPIIIQHHAEMPRSGLTGLHQRWALSGAGGFFFAARGLAESWINRRVIGRDTPIFEVMEGSTLFTVHDRAASRRRSGMEGSPVFLWVGRLDENKDPFTVLAGFERVLPEMPGARFYMAYGPDSPLLNAVEKRIDQSEVLSRAVQLLGTVPHAELETVFNSADYFVLGSRYEGSGFALAEALACGVVPIVTDIPSFRMMTGDGSCGALWTPGNPRALAAVFDKTFEQPLGEQSPAARALFDRRLSYAAIGREAVAAYQSVLNGPASDPTGTEKG